MLNTEARVYVDNIDERTLCRKIREGLDFIGCHEIINKGSTIFVKPNLTDAVHRPGITTTPSMSRAVLRALSPLVKKVYVGESDGGNYSYSADRSLKNHGIVDAAGQLPNVEVVNLSKLPRTRVEEVVCGKKVWVDLPDLLIDTIDCLVSVPVLKTHAMTHGSYSIKNLWGCYPDPMRLLYHKNLDYKLALINKKTKNRIQIVDGFWALDGHGPMEGTPRAINRILVANDPVAADATAARMMRLDTRKITHLGIAERYGLGVSDPGKIRFSRSPGETKLRQFKPYKIKLDYLNSLLFNSETLAKLVLASPLTPVIYSLLNATKPAEKRTYPYRHNLKRPDLCYYNIK